VYGSDLRGVLFSALVIRILIAEDQAVVLGARR
jgi:hypothetical protein